jgi:heme-binding HmuY-like protein
MALHEPASPHTDVHQKIDRSATDGHPAPPPWFPIRRWLRLVLLAVPVLGLAAVFLAPWLFPGPPVGNFTVTPAHPVDVGGQLVGPLLYTIDARSSEQWTYFDFSRGSVVAVPQVFGVDWDLAFQRHQILSNGGATNPKGRGGIMDLGETAFDGWLEAPAEGYVEDTIATINTEAITTENLAIKSWYTYNVLTHILRPKPHVYTVRTADGKYAKMRLVSYYCDGGQASACFTIEYVYQGDGSRSFQPHHSSHSELGTR